MTEFFLNVLATTPVLAALMLVAAVNTRRERRVQQTMVPVFAAVYMIVALILIYRFNNAIANAVIALNEALPASVALGISSQLKLIENLILLLLFLALKVFIKPFATWLFKEGRSIGRDLVEQVYEYDSEHELWFINRRYGDLRTYFRAFYWGSVTLTVLIMAAARTFSDWPGFYSAAYPAAAALIIGEIYFALDGRTREEYTRDILGEEDRSRRVANFGPLRGVLVQGFSDLVLADGIQISSRDPLDSAFRVSELARSDDSGERLAGTYFDRLRQARHDIDINLVDASVTLLHGQSVLLNNPFYADLTPYVSVPAYLNLLRYQKVLIVAGRDSLADDLMDWIRKGLESITGVPDLWIIDRITERTQDLDVGVLRFADIHNLELLARNDQFFQSVGLVVIVEPARMMATGQLGLSLLFSRCSQGQTPAFAAIDGNHDGLVDALSHLVKVSLTEVVASTLPRGANSEVIWKADGAKTQASVLPTISRYLGVGTEIGAVALKYQVRRVHWIGSETFPVVDMNWIAAQYYGAINSFAGLELSQDAFEKSFLAVANPWQMSHEENYFLIVEDESFNIYETVRRFSSRATSVGVVNVLSRDYLLRDYMVDNRDLFICDPKAIPAVVPDFARTQRNAALRMLLGLVSFEVTADEIRREFEIARIATEGQSSNDGSEASDEAPLVRDLRRAFSTHIGVKDFEIRMSSHSRESEQVRLSIVRNREIDEAIVHLRPAYFIVEDEREDVSRIGSLLYGHVYQSLLPGQFVTFGGKYYEVQSIVETSDRCEVILRRAADHIRDRRVYRQLREYRLEGLRQAEHIAAHQHVGETEIIRAVANITATPVGYVQLLSRSDLHQAKRVLIGGLPERTYVNKNVLVVKFPGIEPQVRMTIAILLNELFVTVFPHSYEYISAVTPDPHRIFGDLLPLIDYEGPALGIDEYENMIVIVEDSMIDLGLLVAVERLWDRLMEMIADYLEWNASPRSEEPQPNEFVPQFPDRPERVAVEPWWKRVLRRLGLRRPRRSAPPPSVEPVSDTVEFSTGTEDQSLVERPEDAQIVTVEAANADLESQGDPQFVDAHLPMEGDSHVKSQ